MSTMSKVIYAQEKHIKNKVVMQHFIPYRITRSDTYELRKIYFNNYWGQCFQVLDIYKNQDTGKFDNAEIRWDDGCYGRFCTELSVDDYLMKKDRKNIYSKKEIINTNKAYTGAEIAYWFYMHDIGPDTKRYQGFWQYVDLQSDRRLHDASRYILSAREERDGTFTHCKVKKIKS